MRLLKLVMRAFGPYAGEQTVDFTALKGRNLFLITGPTGSGKTTIFDAICYVIYGKASGRDRDGESLRSHFAQEDLLTSVELEFELRGKRYWVKRIPKQLRRRARGDGFTEQNAEAELKTLDDNTPIVEGVRQVDDRISQILGITYDQFKQIIMIPQGEFRELLTSNSSNREDILQKIFGTELFRLIQEKLGDREKVLRNEVKELANQREGKIRSLDTSSNESLAMLLASNNLNVPAIVKETKTSIEKDNIEVSMFDQQIAEQENLLSAKQQESFTAQENNRKLKEKDQAEHQKAELELQKPLFDLKKETLENARKAAAIKGIEDHYSGNAQIYEQRFAELQTAEKQEQQIAQLLQKATETFAKEKEKESERQNLNTKLLILQGLTQKIEELQTGQQECARTELLLTNIKTAQHNTQTEIARIIEKNIKSQRALEESLNAAKDFIQKCSERDQTLRLLTKINSLKSEQNVFQTLLSKRTLYEEKATAEKNNLEKKQREYELTQKLYFHGLAGVLAENLRPEESCPVCGSVHHPKPAARAEGVPSDRELTTMDEHMKDIRNQYELTKSAWDKISADCLSQERLVARIQGELDELNRSNHGCYWEDGQNMNDPETSGQILQNKIKILEDEVTALAFLKDQEGEIRKQIQLGNELQKELEIKLEKICAEEKVLYSTVNSLIEVTKRIAAELPGHIRNQAELSHEVAKVQQEFNRLQLALETARNKENEAKQSYASAKTSLQNALKNLTDAKSEMENAFALFKEARDKAGFGEIEDYRSAKRTVEDMSQLQQEIEHYEQSLRSAVDHFNKIALAVAGLQMTDITILEEAMNQIRLTKENLTEKRNTAASRKSYNETLLESILESGKKIGSKEEEYEIIGDLANTAKGNNNQRISFERYVLAAFFNDIIAAANVRLDKMTGGRYRMSRIIEKGKGLAQSGLELEVLDYYTGRSRHVKTLSGGESFKASLALALGLADVVQSYAGGVSLETMFVDEGFGTLDPESLDSAVNCLMELQYSGRLVGIISHVPELKTSIEARLEVTANKDGSSACFTIVG